MKTIPHSVMKKFLDLACQLSPENLSCDGELSQREEDLKYNRLITEWKKLEKEIGRKVSEDEVWEWQEPCNAEKFIDKIKG